MSTNGATTTVPKVCRAAVTRNPGPDYYLETIEDFPVPSPAPGELLLRLNVTGLCNSDPHMAKGDWGLDLKVSCVGHEGAGVVAAIGEGVEGWKVGERAGIRPIFDVCHECEHCHNGMEGLCPKVLFTGNVKDGSYAEYVVSPARYTTRIPTNVLDEHAAPLMCSGTTIYVAIKRSGIRAGQWLVLPGGGGGVGHLGIAIAKSQGIRVVVIDSGPEKKAMCEKLGCEAFLDFKTVGDVAAEVKKVTGGGAHAVIVTGGTAGAYSSAPAFLRPGGTLVAIGLPPVGTAMCGADPVAMVFQALTFKGSLTGNLVDTDEVLDFVDRGLFAPVVEVRPFEQFKEAFADLIASKVAGRLAVKFRE